MQQTRSHDHTITRYHHAVSHITVVWLTFGNFANVVSRLLTFTVFAFDVMDALELMAMN